MNTGYTIVAEEAQPTVGVNEVLIDRDTGLPVYSWARDDTVVNKLDLKFDYNDPALVEQEFARREVYAAQRSEQRYTSQDPLKMELRGVRTANGGEALMDALALAYMQRWGYPPPRLKVSVTYRGHILEPGDRLLVTHPLIDNPLTGVMGITREQFEVVQISPFFETEGHLELELLWVGAIETSAAPVKTLANLVPGLTNTNGTDTPIPLSGSVTVTTAASIASFRIGLKRQLYRQWLCVFNVQQFVGPKGGGGSCQPAGTVPRRWSYTGSITYRMEYKTNAAPDAPGSGGNPTTGWVELLASKTVGAVNLYSDGGCGGGPPSLPGEEFFAEFFGSPAASPNTYNVKVFWTAVGTAGSPCGGTDPNICNIDGFCAGTGTLNSSTLEADLQSLTLDYVESIS